jgi:hypothetical protein
VYWSSSWPSNPERSARVAAFQQSPQFGAEQPTSEFWDAHAARTRVVATPDALEVTAGFALAGPGDRAPRRIPAPAGVSYRLRRLPGPIGAAAETQHSLSESRRVASTFRPCARVDRSLSELPEYAAMRRTHPLAPIPIYRYATHLCSVASVVSSGERVLEIGSGTGLLSLAALRLLGAQQAVLVDLPQMLLVAFTVLTHFEGDGAVALPNEAGDSLPDARYVLLTPGQIAVVPTASVDLALNTSSFQEMTYPTIGSYFDLVERVARPGSAFYCSNLIVCRKVPDSPIEFEAYPWRPEWRRLLDREFTYGVAVHGDPMWERLVEVGSNEPGGLSRG